MTTWKTAALALALAAAAGVGASLLPVAHGQTTRVAGQDAIEIFTSGRASRLGVTIRDVEATDAKAGPPAGVAIESVTEGSAADRAGLRKGDIVVEFDGERVRSARQFTRLVQESVAGRPVTLIAFRDGQRQSLTVSPEEGSGVRLFGEDWFDRSEALRGLRVTPPSRPVPPRAPAPPAPPMVPDFDAFVWRSGTALGLTLNELSPQLAEYFGATEGVLVTSVQDESVAARAGVKAGDVVTSVNGSAVSTPAQFRREIQRLGGGEEFTLGVVRDRKALTLKGKTEERRGQRRTFRAVV